MARSKISLVIIGALYLCVIFNVRQWLDRNSVMRWDVSGYYMYLPAVFIYHDLGKLQFYPEMVQAYGMNNRDVTYGVHEQPTGNKVNKYAVGTSLFELPFFLLGHFYATHSHVFPADGYSQPYQEEVVFASVFWVLAGFYFLRKFLVKYYSETVTAITLLLIGFGTNLYFYTVFAPGMSHPYSFALFCFLLYVTEQWYSTERGTYLVLLSVILGFIVITRPTNIIVGMLPLCWPYKGSTSKTMLYKKQLLPLLCSLLLFPAIVMIQCSYLKYTSGSWTHFSYEGESFNFLSPQVWEGLFSYRKGWFVYTPLAIFIISGLMPLVKKHKRLALILAAYLAVHIYIVFSWYQWYYGGGFSGRPFVESMAVLAIPLAALIQWVLSQKTLLKGLVVTLFMFFIMLNMFQSYQLKNSVIRWDGMNKDFYWRSFGKLH